MQTAEKLTHKNLPATHHAAGNAGKYGLALQDNRARVVQSKANSTNKRPDFPQINDDQQLVDKRPVQKKQNDTGLPDTLKTGIENLSGQSLDDVKVHYNSSQPAQLNALAYAQGTNIHVAPGQEKHLPHEAWHVVQQQQGRVKPTMQLRAGTLINDSKGLEHEADVMGQQANRLVNVPVIKPVVAQAKFNGVIQRQLDKTAMSKYRNKLSMKLFWILNKEVFLMEVAAKYDSLEVALDNFETDRDEFINRSKKQNPQPLQPPTLTPASGSGIGENANKRKTPLTLVNAVDEEDDYTSPPKHEDERDSKIRKKTKGDLSSHKLVSTTSQPFEADEEEYYFGGQQPLRDDWEEDYWAGQKSTLIEEEESLPGKQKLLPVDEEEDYFSERKKEKEKVPHDIEEEEKVEDVAVRTSARGYMQIGGMKKEVSKITPKKRFGHLMDAMTAALSKQLHYNEGTKDIVLDRVYDMVMAFIGHAQQANTYLDTHSLANKNNLAKGEMSLMQDQITAILNLAGIDNKRPSDANHVPSGTISKKDSKGASHALGTQYEITTGYPGGLKGQKASGMSASFAINAHMKIKNSGDDLAFIAGHLVTKGAGGPKLPENLAPIPGYVNTKAMRSHEMIAESALRQNKVIFYRTIANYTRSATKMLAIPEEDQELIPQSFNVKIAEMGLKNGDNPEDINAWDQEKKVLLNNPSVPVDLSRYSIVPDFEDF